MSDIVERIRELLEYDESTGVINWRVSRGTKCAGSIAGRKDKLGYINIDIDKKTYKAHRIAFVFMLGRMPLGDVDHINGVPSDNRWANLRECTAAENQQNQASAHKGKRNGKMLGAHYHKTSGKYQAVIKIQGKNKYLGLFDTESDAFNAYCKAKTENHPFSSRIE